MHPTNLLARGQLELAHGAIIALALETGALVASCVDGDGLHVVFLPRSHADRVDLLLAYHQLSGEFGARAKNRRLRPIPKMQLQTVNTHADTSCDLRKHARLKLSAAVELVCLAADDFLDFWEFEVLACLGTLHC